MNLAKFRAYVISRPASIRKRVPLSNRCTATGIVKFNREREREREMVALECR